MFSTLIIGVSSYQFIKNLFIQRFVEVALHLCGCAFLRRVFINPPPTGNGELIPRDTSRALSMFFSSFVVQDLMNVESRSFDTV